MSTQINTAAEEYGFDTVVNATFKSWLSQKKYTEISVPVIIESLSIVDLYITGKLHLRSIFECETGNELNHVKKILVKDKVFRDLNRENQNRLFMAFDQFFSFVCKSKKETAKLSKETFDDKPVIVSPVFSPEEMIVEENDVMKNNINAEMVKAYEVYQNKMDCIRGTILREYPNGFSFNAMSLRLLRDKTGFDIDEFLQSYLRRQMFNRSDKVWFFPDMIADKDTRQEIIANAEQWLEQYRCFSILALYESVLPKISDKCTDIHDFEFFFTFLSQNNPTISNTRTVSWWNMFRVVRAKDVKCQTAFREIARQIELTIDNAGGMVIEEDLQSQIPALDSKLLAAVVKEYLPQIIKTDINGLDCLQNILCLGLPADFSERLTEIITRLEELDLPVSEDNLHTALSLFYETNFYKEYKIPDKKTFRRLITRYYDSVVSRSWSCGIFSKEIGNVRI